MEVLYKLTKSLSDAVGFVSTIISGLFVFLVLALVSCSVLFRVLNISLSWSEELARWLLIGLTFISGSLGLKHKKHIGLTLLRDKVFPKQMLFFILLSNFVILAIVSFSFYYSLMAAIPTASQYGDIIKVPMLYTKMTLPLGFLFMIIHLVFFQVEAIYKRDDLAEMYSEKFD